MKTTDFFFLIYILVFVVNAQSKELNLPAKSSNSDQPSKSDFPAKDIPGKDKVLATTFPVSEDVKEAKERMRVDEAKGLYYQSLANNLSDSVTRMNIAIVNEEKKVQELELEERQLFQKTLKAVSEYQSLSNQVQRCNGRGDELSLKELSQMADIEAKRLLNDELEPLIWYSNKNKYRRMFRDLHNKIRFEKLTVENLLKVNGLWSTKANNGVSLGPRL